MKASDALLMLSVMHPDAQVEVKTTRNFWQAYEDYKKKLSREDLTPAQREERIKEWLASNEVQEAYE